MVTQDLKEFTLPALPKVWICFRGKYWLDLQMEVLGQETHQGLLATVERVMDSFSSEKLKIFGSVLLHL